MTMGVSVLGPVQVDGETRLGPRERTVLSALALRAGQARRALTRSPTRAGGIVARRRGRSDPGGGGPAAAGVASRQHRYASAPATGWTSRRTSWTSRVSRHCSSARGGSRGRVSPNGRSPASSRRSTCGAGSPSRISRVGSPPRRGAPAGRAAAQRGGRPVGRATRQRRRRGRRRGRRGWCPRGAPAGATLGAARPRAVPRWTSGRRIRDDPPCSVGARRTARRRPGQELVSLETAILRQDASLDGVTAAPPSSGSCPYPGLVPFDTADHENFFGRDREIADGLAVSRPRRCWC